MKLKVMDLLQGHNALTQFCQIKHPPHSIAYRAGRAMSKLESLAKEIEIKRVALIKQYGKPSEDGKTITVPDESMKEFESKVQELMDSEVEVDVHTIDIQQLHNPIEPSILGPLLGWFIVDSEGSM